MFEMRISWLLLRNGRLEPDLSSESKAACVGTGDSASRMRPATTSHERHMLASAAMRQPTLRTLLLAAPVIFIAHFTEEGPDFVAWFNAHVSRGITEPLFRSVNYTALAITAAVVLLEWLARSTVSAAIAVM